MDKVDNSANRHIFDQSDVVVGLFAKQPVPGQVKTRLSPPLSPLQASQLYEIALRETLIQLLAAEVAVTLCYSGEQSWFRSRFPQLPLLPQQGEELGERMSNAVDALFRGAGCPVLLCGSDSPDLPVPLIREVVTCVQENDVVTLPCRDGGYAMIGLRRPVDGLFADIPWSTAQVLDATRRRCRTLGLSYHATQSWHDLDEVADLRRLVVRSPDSETARHVVSELGRVLCSSI